MNTPSGTPVPGPQPAPGSPAPGQSVGAGRYLLKKVLGQGGMGVVWLAHDLRLREPIALKFLPAQIAADPAALDALRRETLRSRKLSHPNIVRIHDLCESPNEPTFISMEFVDGSDLHSLRARRDSRVLSWKFLEPLIRQLCAALDYAHGERIIHRDLKPANLMLDSNQRLKLADFGLAHVASDSLSRLSGPHFAQGTFNFMSPQQADGRKPQVTDDIYSLGATLYELLTSTPPFHTGDIAYQLRNTRPEPMAQRLLELELANEIPSNVSALVMACLAKEPEQRPSSAKGILEWLEAAERDQAHVSVEANIAPPPPTSVWTPPAERQTAPPPPLAPLSTSAESRDDSLMDSAGSTGTFDSVPPQPGKRLKQSHLVALMAGGLAVLLIAAFFAGAWFLGRHSVPLIPSKPAEPPNSTASPGGQEPPTPSKVAGAKNPVMEAATPAAHESPTPHKGRVNSVAFSRNGQIVASGGDDKLVRLWLPFHKRTLPPLTGHGDPVLAVAFSPSDNRLLASGGADQTVRLWNVETAQGRSTRMSGGPVRALAFSKDGQTLFCGTGQGKIQFLNLQASSVTRSIQAHANGINFLALSTDGKLLASAGNDHSLKLWETQSGRLNSSFEKLSTNMLSLAFSPDGRTLAAAGGEERYHIFDIPLGVLKRSSLAFKTMTRTLAYQPDGDWLIVNGDARAGGLQVQASDGALRSNIFPSGTGEIVTMAVGYHGVFAYGTENGMVGHSARWPLPSTYLRDPFGDPDPGLAVKRTVPVEPPVNLEVPVGWVRLWKGTGLQGWEIAGNSEWDRSGDSVIAKGEGGALLTSGQYGNFEFKADVKFAYGGVAGLGFRMPEDGPGGCGTEAHNDIPPNIQTAQVLPGLLIIHNNIVPHDTWFNLHVIGVGNHFKVFLNHRLVVNMMPGSPVPSRGRLALLQRAPATVSFRSLMVHPLPGDENAASAAASKK